MSVATSVVVRGLYGEFTHRVALKPEWEFAIIYGPNGVGKTRFLEIAHALSRLNVRYLYRSPFTSAAIAYSDGSELAVARIEHQSGEVSLDFELTQSTEEAVRGWTWVADDSVRFLHGALSDRWRDLGDGMWIDDTDGEIISEMELATRYGWGHRINEQSPPEDFVDFSATHRTLLIETQRLTGRHSGPSSRGRQTRVQEDTVSFYAEDMKHRLSAALGENSRVSQSLDRTFPQRLLATDVVSANVDADEIRRRYEAQNAKSARLAELGLSRETVSELPDAWVDPWKLAVLDLYLSDTEEKLRSFDQILQKIDLLRSIIDKRFLRKKVHVDSEVGLAIVPTGREENIPPRALSSGEKHELIMFYDLLFRAAPGTLVLIDEPEISLHVSWQREFLGDIKKVAELSGIRTLVATHSPQIIGPHRDKTTSLGNSSDLQAME